MRITGLRLDHFRNYLWLEFAPGPGLNVIYGANGAGKTNLLEAVYCLSHGFSFRAGRDADLPTRGQAGFTLRAEVEGSHAVWIQVDYREGQGRRWTAGGDASSRREAAGLLPTVLFAPEDLEIVAGQPQARRRFMDQLCSQVVPGYARWLSRYARVVTQRNELLREAQTRRLTGTLLEAWDEEMSELGGRLWAARWSVLVKFRPLLAEAYAGLGRQRAELVWNAALEQPPPEDGRLSPALWQAALMDQLRAKRRQEIVQGVTVCGPHRDAVALLVDGGDVRQYGSRGEQRSMALALRLGQLLLLHTEHGAEPVLLLDDVFSELDENRREALARRVPEGAQAFLTCTRPAWLPRWVGRTARYFCVDAGTVDYRGEDGVPPSHS